MLAFQLWSGKLSSVECVAYLDNEGARYSLIKGYSASWAITRICHLFAKTCEMNTSLPWCARVPSCSNIADHPSRSVAYDLLPQSCATDGATVSAHFKDLVQSVITLSSHHLFLKVGWVRDDGVPCICIYSGGCRVGILWRVCAPFVSCMLNSPRHTPLEEEDFGPVGNRRDEIFIYPPSLATVLHSL